MDVLEPPNKKRQMFGLPRRQKTPHGTRSSTPEPSRKSTSESGLSRAIAPNQTLGASRVTFDGPERLSQGAPPAYDDDTNSSLALPISRLSESSRSDGSSGDHIAYASTTTTHTISTTTTFFRLPHRKKNKGPLFPLPVKIPPPDPLVVSATNPRASTSGRIFDSPNRSPTAGSPLNSPGHRPFHNGQTDYGLPSPLPSPSHSALAITSLKLTGPGSPLLRTDSTTSARSAKSSSALAPPMRLGRRGRSSTMGSLTQVLDDAPLPTPPMQPPGQQSGRTSTSTTGRSSLGGLFNLNRLRQSSEPALPRYGSSGTGIPGTPRSSASKDNTLGHDRETFVVPEREEGDTPAKYLVRLEEAVSRGVVASILSKAGDDFSLAVLRSYMRGFSFFGDPMDMAIRKLLMEVELPKETQQIDRVLQGFANRYHECNPGIYMSSEQAYYIAFSILILHTDVFNKNNKHKMQKSDYVRNTKDEGIADEILECFYDNISYTPFIHVEDDIDINGERIIAHKSRKTLFRGANVDPLKKASKEQVDPYNLILDNNLDVLRPTLKDVMTLEDPYDYLGTAESLDLTNLHKTFFKSGVLQIVSSRSRPEAFMSQATITNPAEAHPGLVDIKVTKVGILWRKDAKKKKTRSPWQEWGAILTGSQLYFFRNTAWIKNLVHQYDSHHRQGHAGSPVTFKPPLEQFKPDALMSTDDAVGLLDSSYKKHKHAFIFVRHGGFEETFLADNESEMNDWLAKLNYAAAFRTAGVRMRGVVGGNYEGQRSRGIRRMDSTTSARSIQTPTGEVSIQSGQIDRQLAQQILEARRQIMARKIEEADDKLSAARKQLDGQLRNARHLQILSPIQAKTREHVILAAGRMNAKLKWVRMEIWRLRCHKDILKLDLDEEAKAIAECEIRNQRLAGAALPAVAMPESSKSVLGRLDPKNIAAPSLRKTSPSEMSSRPATEPVGGKTFTMDDIFQNPPDISRQSSYHKAQSSWELPPLSFEAVADSRGSGSSMVTRTETQHSLTHHSSVLSIPGGPGQSSIKETASRLATPTPSLDDEEKEILKEAGLVGPDGTVPDTKRPNTASDSEMDRGKPRSPEPDINESRVKVRRSLHRTLREAHVPAHHRSRKGKDSASSAAMTEDGGSIAESEGLARGTGSFTVHGKKASVITFGSEWQNMSPEERLKLRKQAQSEDSKLAVATSVEDDSESILPASVARARPVSTRSASTGTARSLAQQRKGRPVLQSRISTPDQSTDASKIGENAAADTEPIESTTRRKADTGLKEGAVASGELTSAMNARKRIDSEEARMPSARPQPNPA
ncbi:MAG: hypothetical protein M1830_009146 [Pleopsidium flavum]|nr:MAG: hypothetical protein M1830_009146 [Pleopsidium flavum]